MQGRRAFLQSLGSAGLFSAAGATRPVKLFLCGDVMTGRGIDQILQHPCQPRIYEDYVKSALDYVRFAESRNGPIPRAAAPSYIWGDALEELDRVQPDLRIVNLETSITTSEDHEPKGINYRMHPANAECLASARIDCCVLANNHVLDWGRRGLTETLQTLREAGIQTAGAGENLEAAQRPAIFELRQGGRVLIYAIGGPDCGIPPGWAAGGERSGVGYIPDFSHRTAASVAGRIAAAKRPGDIVAVSIHWGSNWGYTPPREHREFAHRLIDAGVADVIHGHSSHHPKGIEIRLNRLILYGCGDFLNDYEGIGGYEEFRGDLALMYLPTLKLPSGELRKLELKVFQIRRFRLRRASRRDAEWLADVLNRESHAFGAGFSLLRDGTLQLT